MRWAAGWWRRVRGWWLVAGAAAVMAGLSAAERLFPGVVAAIAVGAGSAIAAVFSGRGQRMLDERSTEAPGVFACRVDQIVDPILVGVKPAAAAAGAHGRTDRVPPFVERDRTTDLVAAVRAGGFVLVVGDSAVGKTRLAYEVVRRALPRHTLIRPRDRAEIPTAVRLATAARRSILWLDDLELYLGASGLTATDLAVLPQCRGRQFLVLATMRAHERARFSLRRDGSRESADREAARLGRDVVDAVDTEIRVERRWSPQELARAEELAADPRIAQALAGASSAGLTERIAAAPQLLREWRDAQAAGPVRGAAVVTAAVDARRAGYHQPLSPDLLGHLHAGYLRTRGDEAGEPESWTEALRWATAPLQATSRLLQPTGDGSYLAFDYLVDATAQDRLAPPVPRETWQALIDRVEPDDLVAVGWEASLVGELDHIERAVDRAMAADHYLAAARLAACLGDAGRESRAVDLLEQAVTRAKSSGQVPPQDMLSMRIELAWIIGERMGGQGDPSRALTLMRRVAEDSASVLGSQHPRTFWAHCIMARQIGGAGDPASALAVAQTVIEDATRAFGPHADATLDARFEAAVWTREVAGPAAGADAFRTLLADAKSLAGPDRTPPLDVAWNLAGALLDAGSTTEALSLLEPLVGDHERTYGPRHRRTLNIRSSYIEAVAGVGDTDRAAPLATDLVHDCRTALGDTHPTTLAAKASLAEYAAHAHRPHPAPKQ
jgi:eukaryotic-like serine/threonine-protein kinase